MKIYISKKDYEKLYSVGNDNYPEKYQLTAIYPEKGTQSFCGYTTHCKRPVEIKVLPEMTQEQIERLREWHKELINKKINKATKHNRFWAELRAVNKVFGLNLTAHILDITKIYLNDELISEVKL